MLRRSRILTAGVLTALFVAPGSAVAMPDQPVSDQPVPPPSSIAQSAGQAYQDLRSPDARDAGQVAETPQVAQDLRSPDARDAAVQAAETPQVAQDLRSPDARDVGRVSAPVQQPVVEIREVPSNGFDWGDAGIGAAGIFAMFSIAAGLTLLLGSRRRRRGVQTAH
jgi:hypothetical protein